MTLSISFLYYKICQNLKGLVLINRDFTINDSLLPRHKKLLCLAVVCKFFFKFHQKFDFHFSWYKWVSVAYYLYTELFSVTGQFFCLRPDLNEIGHEGHNSLLSPFIDIDMRYPVTISEHLWQYFNPINRPSVRVTRPSKCIIISSFWYSQIYLVILFYKYLLFIAQTFDFPWKNSYTFPLKNLIFVFLGIKWVNVAH